MTKDGIDDGSIGLARRCPEGFDTGHALNIRTRVTRSVIFYPVRAVGR